ncbi:sensor histidine kinase [Dactylosporangium sp. NPDC048998]|uniref:sensor histidine kinase n=1 Tax=Dactylosporangium sp. NPDC048998 TaxID=3363976 RepID=UPI00371B03E0
MRRDGLLALGFAIVVVVGGWWAGLVQEPPRRLDLVGYALAAAAAGGLAWRRRAPQVPVAVAAGITSVYLLAGYPFGPVLLTVVWGMFEYARRRPLRESALAAAVATAVSVAAVLPRMASHLDLPAVGLLLWGACWLAVPWSIGAVVYMRRQAQIEKQEELVRRTLLEERIRVSREVHDVAGHGFAVVAMQAGVALVVLDERPEQAREALRAIRDTSRAALGELRAVIENIDSPADIGALVEQVRAAGVEVALEHDGLAGASERQRRIAYEVVRESLTDVLRHAEGATAAVEIGHAGGSVTVRISNDGERHDAAEPGPTGAAETRTNTPTGAYGHGIEGMRERVEAAGGSFEVRTERGFEVHARIPR